MGDRASISFRNGDQESVTLFSHWDGKHLWSTAKEYIKDLKKEVGDSSTLPLDRLEPQTVMADFVAYLRGDKNRIRSNYYLGVSPDDGDNSDNGHCVIELKK